MNKSNPKVEKKRKYTLINVSYMTGHEYGHEINQYLTS